MKPMFSIFEQAIIFLALTIFQSIPVKRQSQKSLKLSIFLILHFGRQANGAGVVTCYSLAPLTTLLFRHMIRIYFNNSTKCQFMDVAYSTKSKLSENLCGFDANVRDERGVSYIRSSASTSN